MNPEAISILARSGLPYLAEQRLDRLGRLQDLPAVGYVRSVSKYPSPGRLAAADILQFMTEHDPSDYRVVEFLRSPYGAICIRREGLLYLEFVHGHLSGLLRYAQFQERFLFNFDIDHPQLLLHQRLHQRRFVDPDSLQQVTSMEPAVAQLETARHVTLLAARSQMPDNLLTEILLTDTGPLWIDAKPYVFPMRFSNLFAPDRRQIYSRRSEAERGHDLALYAPRSWSPTHLPPNLESKAIILGSGALGSHLVTYSLERGLGAIYNK